MREIYIASFICLVVIGLILLWAGVSTYLEVKRKTQKSVKTNALVNSVQKHGAIFVVTVTYKVKGFEYKKCFNSTNRDFSGKKNGDVVPVRHYFAAADITYAKNEFKLSWMTLIFSAVSFVAAAALLIFVIL